MDNYINISNVTYREEELRLTLSQLPIVDLGDDFDIEEIENPNMSMKENETKENIPEKKQVTLEAWSKGHVTGLKVKLILEHALIFLNSVLL